VGKCRGGLGEGNTPHAGRLLRSIWAWTNPAAAITPITTPAKTCDFMSANECQIAMKMVYGEFCGDTKI
jgi:hypothetical protein